METNNLDQLQTATEILNWYLAANPEGEDWHPEYQKYPEQWKKAIKADIELEKALKTTFREYSKQVDDFIDWSAVAIKQAAVGDFLDDTNPIWNLWRQALAAVFINQLAPAVEAGGEHTELEVGINVGWSSNSHPAIEFLNQYTFKLVKNVDDTTRKRLNQAVRAGLNAGEDRPTMSKRLAKVVNDTRRAGVIAHTETVRAYNEGRVLAAKELNPPYTHTKKRWETVIGACPICLGLEGKEIALDDFFPGGFYTPPGHPNCRCAVTIHLKK